MNGDGTDGGVSQTYYGYESPGSPDWDYNSWMGIGDRQNNLIPGYSVALSASARQQLLGSDSQTSTGREFQYNGQTFRDDDTSPQKFSNLDIFSPGGVPGTAHYNAGATALGPSSGQSLTSNTLKSAVQTSTGSQDTPAGPTPTPTPESDTASAGSQQPPAQTLAQQFAKANPQFANTDPSNIMEAVKAINPQMSPVQVEELWNKSSSWQEFARAAKEAQNRYSKSFDLLKELYETNVTEQTGSSSGGSGSTSSNSSKSGADSGLFG